MSLLPGNDPTNDGNPCPDAVEMVIVPRTADLGGFEVRRVLPFRNKRMVGPFIFWDEIGPGEFLSGQGLDVLPHPHIGLSTVTFLEEGRLEHRDSVGSFQVIEPGDVNLMHAGSGIVHSERTVATDRASGYRMAGIQSWLASPLDQEDAAPAFIHASKEDLPVLTGEGAEVRVILGESFGERSPVATPWPTLYLDVRLDAGAKLPIEAETEERALYGIAGEVRIEGVEYPSQRMLVLKPGFTATIEAVTPARFMVLGGAVMDGPRHIWWNFVASSKERIEEAKEKWRAREFPEVPGDADEFVPLPG